MKIVVTGALGHIGSLLVRHLAMEFPLAEINMIDNMMTQRFASLFNLPTTGKLKFIENDITKIDLKPILKNANIVIHLAAIVGEPSCKQYESSVYGVNTGATEWISKCAYNYDISLLFLNSMLSQSSPSSIYNFCSFSKIYSLKRFCNVSLV